MTNKQRTLIPSRKFVLKQMQKRFFLFDMKFNNTFQALTKIISQIFSNCVENKIVSSVVLWKKSSTRVHVSETVGIWHILLKQGEDR